MAVLFSVFLGISTLFSIVAVPVCIPNNSVRGFPFLLDEEDRACVGLSDAGDYAFYFFNTNFNIISNAIIA